MEPGRADDLQQCGGGHATDAVDAGLVDAGFDSGLIDSGLISIVPSTAEIAALTESELEQLIIANDAQLRRREVLQALAVAEFGRRGGHMRDGHRSIAAWCRGHLRWSSARAARVVRTGAVLDVLPEVCEHARNGRIPIDHLDDLGRVHANDRVHDHLVDADSMFAGFAQRLFHWQWKTALQRWLQLADADGVQQSHAEAHDARQAAVRIVGEQVVLEAEGGTLHGVFMREVLERFIEAEWLADCDEASARLGTDRVTAADLSRTHRQRSFDALLAVFRAAASAALVQANPDPLVNIVIDDDTADRLMRLVAGADTTPRSPLTFREHRCETIDGVPLSDEAVIGAMLAGRLRRVLMAPDGVVIDLGRSRRLFTGGARDAALLADPRCFWPGCELRTGHCETDHLLEWARGGPTSPRNAGRACRHHNVFRSTHGYTARREHDGRWVVRRPDGSSVGDAVSSAA